MKPFYQDQEKQMKLEKSLKEAKILAKVNDANMAVVDLGSQFRVIQLNDPRFYKYLQWPVYR